MVHEKIIQTLYSLSALQQKGKEFVGKSEKNDCKSNDKCEIVNSTREFLFTQLEEVIRSSTSRRLPIVRVRKLLLNFACLWYRN